MLGAILLTVFVGVSAFPNSNKQSESIEVESIEPEAPASEAEAISTEASAAADHNPSQSEITTPTAPAEPEPEPPTDQTINQLRSDTQDATFQLKLPTINVDAVVYNTLKPRSDNESFAAFEQRVQAALLQGVLHYPTSYAPGQSGKGFKTNIVILGHSSSNTLTNSDPRSQKYKFIFKSLRDLEVNHQIVIWHNQTEYIYQIYNKLIVNPNQVEVLRSGSENKHLKYNSTLTLIACEPPGTINQRMVILARQITPALDENQAVEEGDNAEDEDFVPGKTPSWLN